MPEGLSGETRLFPIIGDPIAFVQSPRRLTASFAARGHDAVCVPMQVPAADLDGVMHGLSLVPNVDGVLVTMPHKFTAFGHCATHSERARLLGVANVMRRNPDRSWHGDMLDGLAFVQAQRDHGALPEGARVLLVGAGGAGSAIAIALLEAGVRELVIHDADASRVRDLLALLSDQGRLRAGTSDPRGFDMVCNATPMGMAAGDPLPVPANLLDPSMFVGDVVAGHGITPLLQAARGIGCRTAGGVAMVEAGQQMMLEFFFPNAASAG